MQFSGYIEEGAGIEKTSQAAYDLLKQAGFDVSITCYDSNGRIHKSFPGIRAYEP